MKIKNLIPQTVINYAYHFPKAILANLWYGFPARHMTVIGVTGTDGKTTTATIIHHLLTQNGYKAGLISSVAAKYGDKVVSTGLHVTSPDSFLLQRIIRDMTRQGITHLVLETTSHGIDQFRTWGIPYKLGVLTNVTHEHLDYHHSYDRYLKTKLKLLVQSQIIIINADDQSYETIKSKIPTGKKCITYGIKKGEINTIKYPVTTILPGDFNRQNSLAAVAVCLELGMAKKPILSALKNFSPVFGRMNTIPNRFGFRVVIDFAHTPNGLKNALTALRKNTGGRLIAVFGCAGLRDSAKRPLMGKISGQRADITVITAEDPRTEDINQINQSIAAGLSKAGVIKINPLKFACLKPGSKKKVYFIINDRQQAINFAIRKIAAKGDTVGIFGKGHEQSMCFCTKEYPWSDHEAVKKALKR